jgi:hypothetical protein
MPFRPSCRVILLVWLVIALGGPASGVDRVTIKKGESQTTLEGRVEVTAQDGGVLLLAPDGVLWPLQPKEIVERKSDALPFEPLGADQIARRLQAELPKGFDVHTTAHYLICYNTTREYAQWCGALFERLYWAFDNYWTRRGFTLSKPAFPLVAVVFADRASYITFSTAELGDAADKIIGYYSLQSNRMTMYDLSGMEAVNRAHNRRGSPGQISKLLAQPEAERNVATIVHEATHQIAYNCGLHARLSDCPLWFSEGIAMFFETPDVSSAKGWRNIGGANVPRLNQFGAYVRKRPADSLETLVADDKRFRDTNQALDAYAEAWSLTYFLIRQRPKQYLEYLRTLSQKKPLLWDTPATRLKELTEAFGDLKKLDAEFMRFMRKEFPRYIARE